MDALAIVGDVVEVAEERAFDTALSAVTAAGLPTAMVAGNHDWRADDLARAKAAEHSIDFLGGAISQGDLALSGVTAGPLRSASGPFETTDYPAGAGARIIVSHFPILSEAQRLAAVGLPYPGDLIDRAQLEQRLQVRHEPRIVLSGHIHARCARAQGSLLQLSSGALIEPPYDAAIVTIAAENLTVTRETRRLGPVAAIEPVFAADYERWIWRDSRWELVDGGEVGRVGD